MAFETGIKVFVDPSGAVRGARRAQDAIRGVGGASEKLRRNLFSLNGSASTLGRTFLSMAARIAGPVAGIAALTKGMQSLVTAGNEFEKSQFVIERLLITTGNAAGVTAAQIEQMAQSIGFGTLESIRGARDAAAALLTFKNVSGEAFERTLRLAADLSAVMGQGLKSSTIQLAKALEDPERNLSQLNRSGISFNQTQISMIKQLNETGRESEALSKILDVIEGQVGGAGTARAGGLAGAWDSFGEALGRRLEVISQTGQGMSVIADALERTAKFIKPATPFDRLAAEQERLDEMRGRLDRGAMRLGFGRASQVNEIEKQAEVVAALTRDIEDMERGQQLANAAATAAAERHRVAAAAERDRARQLEEFAAGQDAARKAFERASRAQVVADRTRDDALQRATRSTAELVRENRALMRQLNGTTDAMEKYRASIPVREFRQHLEDVGVAPEVISRMTGAFQAASERNRALNKRLEATARITAAGERVFDRFGDAIIESMQRGEGAMESFRRAAVAALFDVQREMLKTAVFDPLNKAAGRGISSLVSSFFGSSGGSAAGASFAETAFASAGAGFQHGGEFTVGGRPGVDQNLVQFRASRGERVRVDPVGGTDGRAGTVINIDLRGSNGDESIRQAVRQGIREAAPGLVNAAVNTVRDRRQRDPTFFGRTGT